MKIKTLIIVLLFTQPLYAVEPNDDDSFTVSAELNSYCKYKVEIASSIYGHREHTDEKDMREVISEGWKNNVNNDSIKRATKVDIQRIISDAYRRDTNGEFRYKTDDPVIFEAKIVSEARWCFYSEY